MASSPCPPGRWPRRPNCSVAQAMCARARACQALIIEFVSLSEHRGAQPSQMGAILLRALAAPTLERASPPAASGE
eukprot:8042512-Alexandrium_andersonii.AAC.1